jgi:hypothetical protein
MRPENGLRRKVIREWMSLPHNRRQNEEQAAAFATKVIKANAIGPRRDDPYKVVMAWLAPRTGK